MNNIRLTLVKSGVSLRWMVRLLSIVISCMFLLIIFLAVTNEDKPQGAAIPVLVLLVLNIVGCFTAWQWEKVGGVVVVVGSLCLSVAVYSASLAFGVGSPGFLLSLIYGAPFLVVGILFWICGQKATTGSTEKVEVEQIFGGK